MEYEKAGVSLEAGYESVRRIKSHVARTNVLGVMGSIGGFGGMFDLSKLNMKEPVLVSGTDGVGTKLLIAIEMKKYDTIGQDVVAMCVNDCLAQGAKPLFFLDYIAVGKNDPTVIEQIVKGVADGCEIAECGLIGGETAEMPDMYSHDDFDIAGFSVSAVEKSEIIDGSTVEIGDVLVGLPSSGIHSNGYSLVRKIFFKDNDYKVTDHIDALGETLGEALLRPTKIYVKEVLDIMKKVEVKGAIHVTGGGFDENIPRVLKKGQGVLIQEDSLPKLPIFTLLESVGNIPHREMYNVFNMGIGMVLIVKPEDAKTVQKELNAHIIGTVTSEEGVVIK